MEQSNNLIGVITPVEENSSEDPQKSVKVNPYDVYNTNSIKPIPKRNILFQMRTWRQIYLSEAKNKPFFTADKEITKFIIAGVKEGILQPYTDDTLTKEMTKEEFLDKLRTEESETSDIEQAILNTSSDAGWGNGHTTRSTSQDHHDSGSLFFPNQITTLELMEDLIFDKVSSTFIYDIQSITLIIPGRNFITGLQRRVGTFKYKDLVAYLDQQQDAIWFNVGNSAADKKMTEAIALRYFDSKIVKMDNPTNATLEDIYKDHLKASKDKEEEIIELAWFMWEH